jgi:hypothetical protein
LDDRAISITHGSNGTCYFVVNHGHQVVTPLGTFMAPGGGTFGQLVGSYNGLTTGIAENHNNISLNLFPNPAHGDVVKISTTSAIRYVAVYSAIGQLISESSSIGGNTMELSLNNLSAGQYYVSVRTSEGSVTRKLTVN